MADLIQPEEWECPLRAGGTKTFILSKFPAVAGREIVAKYPMSGMPKLGDYEANEQTMLKLMSYVAVPREGSDPIRLTTRALIDNHCGDWEVLMRIEKEMLTRNCSFFANGQALNFFQGIAQTIQALITKTLMASSAQSSNQEKPPSTS